MEAAETVGPDATSRVNDVGGGWVLTVAVAKGKSAVMNNVCKSEEGMEGGEGVSTGRTEVGGGRRSCLLCSSMLCCFLFVGVFLMDCYFTAYVTFYVNSWKVKAISREA